MYDVFTLCGLNAFVTPLKVPDLHGDGVETVTGQVEFG